MVIENICVDYLKVRSLVQTCRLKIVLYLALVAILFSGAEPLVQIW